MKISIALQEQANQFIRLIDKVRTKVIVTRMAAKNRGKIAENKQRKVVGVGLGKTGTKSLGVCLSYLGYRHQSYDFDLLLNYPNNLKFVLDVLTDKDSCEDFPWPYLYKEIDKIYPDSKFILTLRKDPEKWYSSLCKHFDRGKINRQRLIRPITYGYSTPYGFKKEHIDLYLKHAQEVQDYFSDKPNKLLVVCWENGDGWAEICQFLGHLEPPISFPHVNIASK